MLTLAISHHSSLLERVNQSNGVTKDVLIKLSEVLGIRSPQSIVSVKIKPED